jgi:hypothetical protein
MAEREVLGSNALWERPAGHVHRHGAPTRRRYGEKNLGKALWVPE